MRSKTIYFLILMAFVCLFAAESHGQTGNGESRARRVLGKTAKVGVKVVGKTAKYSWKATKFTAGKVAKPAIQKSAPVVGKFARKQSVNLAKRSFPVVKKFAITYLKFRFSP